QHFVEESHRDASAGSTDRMSESNGAAVDVEFVAVELEVAITGEDLSRERFVQFNKIKTLERQSVFRFQLANRRNGADTHDARVDPHGGKTYDAREWFQTTGLDEVCAAEDHRGRTICDAGRVCGGDGARL